MDTDYVDQETVRPKTLPAGSIQYVGPALGAGARVAARRRQFLVNLIRAETTESDNAAAGESRICPVSNWDDQYDGEEHEENGAQQASAEPLLNPSNTPSTTSIPRRNNEHFDRLDPPRDELGNPITNKRRLVEQCMGCKRYYEKTRGIVHHNRGCELFTTWRTTWVRENTLIGEAPFENAEAGRGAGDTSVVSS
jgi:hypothetical protein